jgi:Thioredoxin-like domain
MIMRLASPSWRASLLAVAIALAGSGWALAADPALPPPVGPVEPRAEPAKDEDGLYHQRWFLLSFLNLKEDFAEAKAAGKRFAVIFEQRGCPYCIKLHTEVLAQRYINDYMRANFAVLQLDIWGARRSPTSTARCSPSGRWPSAGA